MNMKSAEEVYESFLRKNLIISSSFDQISRHRLDSDGQRNRMTLTAFTIFGGLLQVVQVSALFLPEREGKMLRNYSGDYLSAVGISGTALSVILAVIIIHAITDRICYAMTEAAGFPALTIIQTFRTKLSRDAGSKFEQYLQQVNRLEGVADFMFIHSTIALHVAIIGYCVWIERSVLFAFLNVLSLITYMISLRNFIMTFLASQTILLLATKFLVLKISEVKVKAIKVRTASDIKQVLEGIEDVKQSLHVLEKDVGWIISNSMLVFMPIIGFILSAGIASKDLLMRLFLLCVPSSFCLLYLISISTAAQVHIGFKDLSRVLAKMQLTKEIRHHDRLQIDRYVKAIDSHDRPFCFYVCKIFPFTSTTILHCLSLIISFILLLLPSFDQLQN